MTPPFVTTTLPWPRWALRRSRRACTVTTTPAFRMRQHRLEEAGA